MGCHGVRKSGSDSCIVFKMCSTLRQEFKALENLWLSLLCYQITDFLLCLDNCEIKSRNLSLYFTMKGSTFLSQCNVPRMWAWTGLIGHCSVLLDDIALHCRKIKPDATFIFLFFAGQPCISFA